MSTFIKGIESIPTNFAVGNAIVKKMYLGDTLLYPYTYTEIEYLKSTGTQYIDTGIKLYSSGTGNYQINIKLKSCLLSEVSANYDTIVNNMEEVGPNYPGTVLRYETKNINGVQWNKTGTTTVNEKKGDYNTISEFTLTVSNHSASHNVSTTVFASYDSNGAPFRYSIVAIYYLQIYNNGVLVRDYIPVRIGQVGYLYDKVSKQLFGNQGTGSFTLGPDKVNLPSGYTLLEYLESTGAQWMDINDTMAYGDEFEFDFIITNLNSSGSYTGGYVLGANTYGRAYPLGWYKYTDVYNFLLMYQDDGDYNKFPIPQANVRYNVKCHIESGNMQMTVNGVTYTSTKTTAANDSLLALFARGTSQSNGVITAVNAMSNVKLYSLKHWRNGSLRRDLVPVRDGKVGYMYDKVSKQLFGNSGSGNFTLGPDIN